MNVVIKYINRTKLQEKALRKLINRYSKGIKHNICIVFDLRIADCGTQYFDEDKKIHIIKISPIY